MAKGEKGRKVKILAVYSHDAAFFTRLADAVERDEEMPIEWRRDVSRKLKDLAQTFHDAPSVKRIK